MLFIDPILVCFFLIFTFLLSQLAIHLAINKSCQDGVQSYPATERSRRQCKTISPHTWRAAVRSSGTFTLLLARRELLPPRFRFIQISEEDSDAVLRSGSPDCSPALVPLQRNKGVASTSRRRPLFVRSPSHGLLSRLICSRSAIHIYFYFHYFYPSRL